ncbi:radical SAM family heme chaperone HemW [Poriferisphaera sp. WC338]|uniref:radical SAM family heme chaperone HemW n=1 Tax=Poriferisphaera sp. WC338 TaxID=3425129 RepID=UPI003D81935F
MQQAQQSHYGHVFRGKNDADLVDALYVHVPFCFHKCHYCDFYSIVGKQDGEGDRQSAFIHALQLELLGRLCERRLKAKTIFVGGGTPTLLNAECWARLLEILSQTVEIEHVKEFTVEANPETVTAELMRQLVQGYNGLGVNRLSIGAQSFDEKLLKVLERWHDPSNVGKAVGYAREANIKQINLDMIFAIPGQTMAQLEEDVARVIDLEPDHISAYSLIFEPNTPLTQKRKMGLIQSVGEQREHDMYARVIELLAAADYEQYEISNWAKTKDNHCLHNLLYWQNANWLGVGPGAASHVNGLRWKNEAHIGKYLKAFADDSAEALPPIMDIERLDTDGQVGEKLMLGLRLREGVLKQWIDSHVPTDSARGKMIAELKEIGMLEEVEGYLRLTQRGLFVGDAVISRLL